MSNERVDRNLRLQIAGDYRLVTLSVLYYLPDHQNLVNEFLWQTMDRRPNYPRIGAFLDHWRREMDAVIKEIRVVDGLPLAPARYCHASEQFTIV